MDKNNARSCVEFEELLKRLVPLLQALTSKTLIIWLHQYPIIENHNKPALHNNPSNRKYHRYNELARRLLKYAANVIIKHRSFAKTFLLNRDSGVIYWETMFQMSKEYIRSCALNDRNQVSNYRSCYDFIHTGYTVVDRGSQVLFNAMCNRLLFNSSNPSVNVGPNVCCSP